MSIEWEFNLNFGELTAEMTARIPIALGRGGEHLRGAAQEKTPVRDGFLVGSAGMTVSGDETHVTFAGPYARRQHYELTWRHEVGQALYLEAAVIEEADAIIQIVSDTLGEGL